MLQFHWISNKRKRTSLSLVHGARMMSSVPVNSYAHQPIMDSTVQASSNDQLGLSRKSSEHSEQ
jgi:hypothetical protein